MFKAMLMLLWCLHTNHQKFANLNLTHRPSSVLQTQMATFVPSALILGAAFDFVYGFQL